MPWCPKCRFEYVPTVHVCPECRAALVAELPPEEANPTQYGEGEGFAQVPLCFVTGDISAALIRDALTAAGIPNRAQIETDAFLPGFEGVPSAWLVRYGIYVNQRDLERAREVYQAFECRDG